MILRKMTLVLLALVTMAFESFAAQSSEIDAVGCDATNFFLGPTGEAIVANNRNIIDRVINYWSNFAHDEEADWGEYFQTNAGQLREDPCFSTDSRRYFSALTDAWNSAVYEWSIVLQMKPKYDLDLKITDCVLKHNELNPYSDAAQTGYTYLSTGETVYIVSANPLLTITAHPGPFATSGFVDPFFLDARKLPSLEVVALDAVEYTSKGLFAESIVIKRPQTGDTNTSGQNTYTLNPGDQIRIRIEIPTNNTVDIWYGKDNVMLEYIGIRGTDFLADGFSCRWRRLPFPPRRIPIRPIRPIFPWPLIDSNRN